MDTRDWGRRFKHTLISGLFIVGPLSLAFMLLAWFVATVDRLVAPVVGIIGRPIPGLGLATALLIVLGAGMLGSHVAGQHLLEVLEGLVLRVPALNWLYRTIKQVSDIFSPAAKSGFKQFVVVEYPRKGVYKFGFVTKELTLDVGGARRPFLAVFIPTNHLYLGEYALFPKEEVLHTGLSQQQGMQITLSAGAALPGELKAVPLEPPVSSA